MYVSEQIETAAQAFIRNLPADTRSCAVLIDDQGEAHVKGGIFNATGKRDAQLSPHGLSKGIVADFRRELRERTGLSLSQLAADQILTEAAYLVGTMKTDRTPEQTRTYERERKRARRQQARRIGFCIICCKHPATAREDGAIGTTCWPCRDKVQCARARKKKNKKPVD